MTFGGGEPLLYPDFLRRFRALCGEQWRLSAETSLAVPKEAVTAVAEVFDEFIIDCKDTDPDIYRRYTGRENRTMLDNLSYLLTLVPAERVVVRVPRIPDFNDDQSRARSRERLAAMGVARVDCFSYRKSE